MTSGPASGAVAATLGRRREVRRVLAWVLVANLVVIGVKLWVGLESGSIAVLGDAAHSGIDALNNLVGLTAMRLAAAPPDERHPYGHGKFETLAALAVAGFLSVTCFELLRNAVSRLLAGGSAPDIQPLMIAALGGVMIVSAAVAWSEKRESERLSSEILAADARHTASDVLVTAGVLAGLAVTRVFQWPVADAIIAIFVALIVAWSGYVILRKTIPVLVDERAMDPLEIGSIAEAIPGVGATSRIRSRGRAGEAFVELTIHVGRAETVVSAHEIADDVERRIAREMGFTDVTIHVEPEVERPTNQPLATDSG